MQIHTKTNKNSLILFCDVLLEGKVRLYPKVGIIWLLKDYLISNGFWSKTFASINNLVWIF